MKKLPSGSPIRNPSLKNKKFVKKTRFFREKKTLPPPNSETPGMSEKPEKPSIRDFGKPVFGSWVKTDEKNTKKHVFSPPILITMIFLGCAEKTCFFSCFFEKNVFF